MTTAEVKKILEAVRGAENTYRLASDKAAAYEQFLTGGKPVRLSGETKAERHGNPVENALIRLADLNSKRDKAAKELFSARLRAEELISLASSEKEREVLTRRYMIGERWEEIAKDMNYSVQHIYRVHGSALQSISKKRRE